MRGAGRSWETSPGILKFIVRISKLKYAFRDHGRQEEILENSALDYTICRAPMLSDESNGSGAVATDVYWLFLYRELKSYDAAL